MPNERPPLPADSNHRRVALVLQGGGALGSYQAGVYQALHEAGYRPDWVAGISIGAINAAIIAGNAPENRVARLKSFWEEVTSPTALWPKPVGQTTFERSAGAFGAMLFGQPGFYAPHSPLSWLTAQPPSSFYDTTALQKSLERLVDFERIDAGETRISVGAVNVRTGQFRSFDSADPKTKIRAKHIMASGALPPGFPSVEIDGDPYWDGGLVSNTPLMQVLEHEPRQNSLVFEVDLFQSYGRPPTSLDEAVEREKDIRFASRTRAATRAAEHNHNVRAHAQALWDKLPAELRKLPEAQFLNDIRCTAQMDIALLIYRPFEPQGSAKDYEFSRGTMLSRWARGQEDAQITLDAAPWRAPFPAGRGTRVSDVLHDLYVETLGKDAARQTPPPSKPA